MKIKRRHFLQFAGSTMASVGLSQFSIQSQAESYGKVLAKDTRRKLALLVGIDNYSGDPLLGCVNDVDLQYHLLVHRFGFNLKDILRVTNEQVTRSGILTAFEEHLIKQARPDDVVVFHYSGHGSRVFDPDPILPEPGKKSGLNSTIVPQDNSLSLSDRKNGVIVKDISGHTLFLLMSAIESENFTAVLDF